jgi:hypothetical protein
MSMQRSPATDNAAGAARRGRRALRLAWVSVALIPVGFVAAMFIGEGLLSAQGFESEAEEFPPLGVTLRAAVPAGLVMIAPALAAVVFGFRAAQPRRRHGRRSGGDRDGRDRVRDRRERPATTTGDVGEAVFSLALVLAGAALLVIAAAMPIILLRRNGRAPRGRAVRSLGFGIMASMRGNVLPGRSRQQVALGRAGPESRQDEGLPVPAAEEDGAVTAEVPDPRQDDHRRRRFASRCSAITAWKDRAGETRDLPRFGEGHRP